MVSLDWRVQPEFILTWFWYFAFVSVVVSETTNEAMWWKFSPFHFYSMLVCGNLLLTTFTIILLGMMLLPPKNPGPWSCLQCCNILWRNNWWIVGETKYEVPLDHALSKFYSLLIRLIEPMDSTTDWYHLRFLAFFLYFLSFLLSFFLSRSFVVQNQQLKQTGTAYGLPYWFCCSTGNISVFLFMNHS